MMDRKFAGGVAEKLPQVAATAHPRIKKSNSLNDICRHSESSANHLGIKPVNNAGLRTDPRRLVVSGNKHQAM